MEKACAGRDPRASYRLDLAPRPVASALACVVRSAQKRGVVEQRRSRDRLEPVEALQGRSQPRIEQIPRRCDRASHDEVGRVERPQPWSEHLAQRRCDVVKRRGRALVAVAATDRDLRDELPAPWLGPGALDGLAAPAARSLCTGQGISLIRSTLGGETGLFAPR